MALHKSLGVGDIHIPFQWIYADQTERLAATGFVASDIHRLALQESDHSVWMLTGYAPIVWTSVGAWFLHGSRHKGDGDDPIPVATTTVNGLLSAADKVRIDAFASGNVTKAVRNETGSPIAKGKLLYAAGWSVPEQRILVGLADKDDPVKRPCLGMAVETIANNANSEAVAYGVVMGLDTSAYAITDQLVLGNTGNVSRPPPDVDPFTGEVQNIGQVTRVDPTDGHILVGIDGLLPVTADQIFALAGTYGSPSKVNKYVTDTDKRLRHVHREARQATDTSTNSTSFVDMGTITMTFTPTGTELVILFTACVRGTNNNQNVDCRVLVDGVSVVGGRTMVYNNTNAMVNAQREVTVTANVSHTVKVQWRTSVGTAHCAPVTNPDFEHASLLVEEANY